MNSLMESAYNMMNYAQNTFYVPQDVMDIMQNLNLASHTGLMTCGLIHKIVWMNSFENFDLKKIIEDLCTESDHLTKDREELIKTNKSQ